MRRRARFDTMSGRRLVLIVGSVLALGGAGLGVSLAAGGDDELVYDSVLGRTVPLTYQQALRDVEPSTLPETGDVATNADVDPSQDPAEDARIEDTTPVPPAIRSIPTDERSNIPFPSGVIAATTLYSSSDGHLERDVYAGGAGCAYGQADSCSPGGNQDFEETGMIIDSTTNLDGIDEPGDPPILLPNTGAVTFTSFTGDRIFFTTTNGRFGWYSLSTKHATAYAVQAFAAPIDNPPVINVATAGRTIPVKWRLTDGAGNPVIDPSTFVSVTSGSTTCSTSDPTDAIETYSGSSGLQYIGDGWWQFNWSTPASYVGQCRVMKLNLAGDPNSPTAFFKFR
jgi:hypothetical protein